MENRYSKRVSEVRPTMECYRHVLVALSKATPNNKIVEEVDSILSIMEQRALLPDSTCYSAAVKTCCNQVKSPLSSRHKDAKNAVVMLMTMSEMHFRSSSTIVKPTNIDFNNVLEALSYDKHKKSAHQAEELLQKMESLYEEGDEHMAPTHESYLHTINTWKKNRVVEEKAEACLRLLDAMNSQYEKGNESCAPNVECFNAALGVCGSVKPTSNDHIQRKKLLLTAVQIVNDLRDSTLEVDSETYYYLIKAFDVLHTGNDEQKWDSINSIFDKCCTEGLVDDRILRTFQKVVPSNIYMKAVIQASAKAHGIEVEDVESEELFLPQDWTSRIEKGRRVIPLSVKGEFLSPRSRIGGESKMNLIRSKENQKLLRGGR